jgi:hypothetical protein
MKIYADNLSADDLYASLPSGVTLTAKPIPSPRVRRYGWIVRLEKPGSSRWRNSGQWGAESVRAASWDDHGVWIAELFRRDQNARIGYYDGQEDFHKQTTRRFALYA